MDNVEKSLSTSRTALYRRNKRKIINFLNTFPPEEKRLIPQSYFTSSVSLKFTIKFCYNVIIIREWKFVAIVILLKF